MQYLCSLFRAMQNKNAAIKQLVYVTRFRGHGQLHHNYAYWIYLQAPIIVETMRCERVKIGWIKRAVIVMRY